METAIAQTDAAQTATVGNTGLGAKVRVGADSFGNRNAGMRHSGRVAETIDYMTNLRNYRLAVHCGKHALGLLVALGFRLFAFALSPPWCIDNLWLCDPRFRRI